MTCPLFPFILFIALRFSLFPFIHSTMPMSQKLSGLTAKMSSLSPFRRKRKEDSDDVGFATDDTSVAGGGRAGQSDEQVQLRVSDALRRFLATERILAPNDAGVDSDAISPALGALLHKQNIRVPPELLDPSFPLADYYISSSHNTYLLAHQLYGASCASGYESTLAAGARCVEIDAWDSNDPMEPKVTHGFTLVSNISFRNVCETVRDAIDKETRERASRRLPPAPPILLSLENHCSPAGQKRLAEIMQEVFGERLAIVGDQVDHVRLETLQGKVCCIVEHYIPDATAPESSDDSDDSGDSDSDDEKDERRKNESEEDKAARKEYREKVKNAPPPPIIPELAAIGVAASVKPSNTSWFEDTLLNGPLRHLINVSESALVKFLPAEALKIAAHNAKHLMRVYPHGLRVSSANLPPVPFWGIGAQICALNWQTFGGSMQINEALFSGTDGYVLKPAALRQGGVGGLPAAKKRLRLRVAGANDIAPRDKLTPYVTCTLVHPNNIADKPPKRKTSGYRFEEVCKCKWLEGAENPPTTDPVWDETLEWEYDDNDLTFLRVLIKSDDKFASNPTLAVAAVRLLYVQQGWSFLRLLDLQGHETRTTLLVHIQVEDA